MKFTLLLLHYYRSNVLIMNDDKTEILVMENTYNRGIEITASNGRIVFNTPQITILGICINANNNMSSQLTNTYRSTMYRFHTLEQVLE